MFYYNRFKIVTNIRLHSPRGIIPHFLECKGRGLECIGDFHHPGYAHGTKVETG